MWPFARRGLRVLMYHRVSTTRADALTVTPAQLDAQVRWLQAEQYTFVRTTDVMRACDAGQRLPGNSVLLTFDDAYVDTLELAHPVLAARGVTAAVFVPTAYIGGASTWDREAHPLMNGTQLATLAAAGWELGLHSHRHLNYATTPAEQVFEDIRENLATFHALGLSPAPVLAYPYGRRPPGAARGQLHATLTAAGIRLGFRIGNRINAPMPRDRFELNRLDIRGDRSFAAFRRKMLWGRLLG